MSTYYVKFKVSKTLKIVKKKRLFTVILAPIICLSDANLSKLYYI